MSTTSRRSTIKLAILGLSVVSMVSPLAVYAASDTDNTTITATVGTSISITTSGTVSVTITPSAGGAVSSNSDTVTVNTNNATGYYLELADADASTNLVSGGNNIAAHSGTFASPTTLGNNTWGYRVDGVGGFGAGPTSAETSNSSSTTIWAGVPASGSATTLKTTASSASNDVTTVWYGVKATSGQPNGAYADTVTYTATTNP